MLHNATRLATRLLLFACFATGLAWGAGDAARGIPPQTMNPDTSAPDAWGYTWVRSNEPGGPTFRWVDISTRGTLVNGLGDDNFVGPFPMQFAFPYYWYTVSSFYVGSNGYLNFSSPANFASPFAALPNTTAPNDLLAICTGDLDFTVAAANPRCYYWSNGNDSLVVSFINVTEWQTTANPNLKHTFQVILNRADSSITYQYGRQEGRYNATNNTTLCIGWENQTGQIGLSYTYSTAPPHALLPDSGIAIKIKRTVNTGLSITDVGVVGGLNAGNLAKVVVLNQPDTMKAIVKNFGTANVTNVQVRYQVTLGIQPAQRDTVIVPALNAGQTVTVTFPRLFVPATTGSYSALFTATVAGDVGPGNNTKTTEILSKTFVANQGTLINFESGTISGSVNWTGGGGMGVAIDLPTYPVRVDSVYVSVGTITTQPMTVEIIDGSTGVPGTVLATQTITATANALNGVSFVANNVRITGGRFFIGARGQMAYNYESTAPISFRTWEFTNGWSPYRSGDLQDVIIRAVVRPEGGTTVRDIGVASLTRSAANDTPPASREFNDYAEATNSSIELSSKDVTFMAMADTARFRAVVQNYGSFPETTYQVRFTVNGNTISTSNNTRILAVGGRDTFNLVWNNAPVGVHVGRAFTLLGTDANRANDTASVNFVVGNVTQQGDTLYSFVVPSQIILGVAKIGASNKLAFTSGGQSSTLTTDNKWITTTLSGTILDTTKLQQNPTAGQGFGFRDLAWDGRWLLTSDNAQVRRIDTATFTEVATRITGPGTLQRGIATSAPNRIWKANFTTDPVVVFDTTGATVRTYGVPAVAPYGIAFDRWTSRNRGWMWYAEPSLTGQIKLSKVDTATGAIVRSFDYSARFSTGTVGGLDVITGHPNYAGRVIALMVVQQFPSSVLLAIDLGPDSSTTSVDGNDGTLPSTFSLQQNYPNPFNPTTTIQYGVSATAQIRISIFDVLGQRIATLMDNVQGPGVHTIAWQGKNDDGQLVTSGIYFYQLTAIPMNGGAPFTSSRKMMFLK